MAEALKKVLSLLGILSDQDVEWIVRTGIRRKIPVGTPIILEGKPNDALFFILGGEFSVTSAKASGEIARVRSGEVVGEVSFVDSRPPSATVTAKLDSVVGAVSMEALQRKLEDDLGFASRFYKSMAVILADRLRASRNMGYKPAAGVRVDEGDDEIAPELLDAISMAGNRFADMQRRPWGSSA